MTDKIIDAETIVPVAQDPQALAALFSKLARVMGNLSRLPKSGHNSHFNYDFVTDSDVSDAVRNALAVEGVAFFAHMRGVQRDDKKVVAHFTYTFADGETGATWACDWTGEAIDTQDKGTAKAATSALKYFLLKTFILSTGDLSDDADSDGTTPPAKPARKPTKASGNGKKADPMTEFWSTVRELEIDNAVAKSYLDKCKGDAAKAKDMLIAEA